MYMSQGEVVQTLQSKAEVDPGFTLLVWQKLEEQNQEFFQGYAMRLQLKDQINLFNHLLDQQAHAMPHAAPHANLYGARAPSGSMRPAGGAPSMQPMPGGPMPYMGGGPHGGYGMGAGGMGDPLGGMGPRPGGMPGMGVMGGAASFAGPGNAGPVPVGGGMGGPGGNYYGTIPAQEFTQYGVGASQGGWVYGGAKGGTGNGKAGKGGADKSKLPHVFSLSDLTMEMSNQLSTDGDASLSLLAGLGPEDSLGAGMKVVSMGGLSTGTLPKNFSLTDMAKLDAPTELDMQMKG